MWQRSKLTSLGGLAWLASAACWAVGPGCAEHSATVEIVNFTGPEKGDSYYQHFPDAWFRKTAAGDYEILLESSEPMDTAGRDVLRQSMFIRVLWRPVPGKTFTEASQINAHIYYQMEVSDAGSAMVVAAGPKKLICWQGSGFVSFSMDHAGNIMQGRIEQAVVQPRSQTTDRTAGKLIPPSVGRGRLTGRFRARRGPGPIAEYKVTRARACP